MSITQLLTTLATAGITLRRLPGDQLEITGPLSEELREQIVEHKPEVLAALPDPAAEAKSTWQKMIDEGNAITPPTWFPNAEDWRRLDEIEDRFFNANGDIPTMRQACTDYLNELQRQLLIDSIHQWADQFCSRCGFARTDEQVICQPCRKRMSQEREAELRQCPEAMA